MLVTEHSGYKVGDLLVEPSKGDYVYAVFEIERVFLKFTDIYQPDYQRTGKRSRVHLHKTSRIGGDAPTILRTRKVFRVVNGKPVKGKAVATFPVGALVPYTSVTLVKDFLRNRREALDKLEAAVGGTT